MRNKSYIIWILVICSIGAAVILVNMGIESFQDQISKRDKLIQEYSIKQDSLRKSNTELIASLNKLFSNANVSSNGTFDVVQFIANHNNLKDSLKTLKFDIDFIYDVYKIKVIRKVQKDGSTNISVVNVDKRIDSGLVLLDFYRDRLTKTKDGWEIKTVGKDYEEWRVKYNDLVVKINSLQSKYDSLVDKSNKETRDLNNKINIYRSILEDLKDKGLIKLDSLEN